MKIFSIIFTAKEKFNIKVLSVFFFLTAFYSPA